MLMPTVNVRFEQAVYGSFPFWNRGYAVLASSAGCRPQWLAELRAVCQQYGEAPAGTTAAESLFALRMKSGPWMIVGVYPQGCDDRGRPGALAFHALFIGRWLYRWAGADPFAFTGQLHGHWCPEDAARPLPTGVLSLHKSGPAHPRFSPAAVARDPRISAIITALTRKRRVVVQSSTPIDALARDVWLALRGHVRRRSSLATWVYRGASNFDLAALPKIADIELDARAVLITDEWPSY
jgi:hypothetical protein